ncbi:MAG TPA: hypothetical protein HA354_02865 [Candidatus Poseidoniaceae archaeon]|nr:MAG TPA: hypothetical protein D7I07_02845 [Candidatus Poseidoniales archaeon]HII37422.1 hypothetical protein [Candidatus Poseidoniaceae archaeon]
MAGVGRKKPFSARLWLTVVALCQVFLTPLIAFTLTYLFDFSFFGESINITFQKEMIPWITAASLMYGMVALLLALIIGGYTPLIVIESGGWFKFLRFSRSQRSATQRRVARQNYANSPHGQITVLAHQRWQQGHSIISTHGGLILLAVPFQVLLATLPLAMVLMVPDTVMRENRRLELALILYIFTLGLVMKYYPKIAGKYIGIASFTRKWLISMTKISWLAPVLILWLMGRMASVVVLGWIGSDIDLNIDFEKSFFESTLNIGSIPETSFLDLIAALAVIPLATFTTLAVLGAGSGDPPEWMAENLELQETREQNLANSVNNLANTIIAPEITETVAKFVPRPDHPINSDTNHDHGEQKTAQHPALETKSESELEVDEPDEFGFEHFFDGDFGQQATKPSHDEPVVRGFK